MPSFKLLVNDKSSDIPDNNNFRHLFFIYLSEIPQILRGAVQVTNFFQRAAHKVNNSRND